MKINHINRVQTFRKSVCEFRQQAQTCEYREYDALMALDRLTNFHASSGQNVDQSNRNGITGNVKRKQEFYLNWMSNHSLFLFDKQWKRTHVHPMHFLNEENKQLSGHAYCAHTKILHLYLDVELTTKPKRKHTTDINRKSFGASDETQKEDGEERRGKNDRVILKCLYSQ